MKKLDEMVMFLAQTLAEHHMMRSLWQVTVLTAVFVDLILDLFKEALFYINL